MMFFFYKNFAIRDDGISSSSAGVYETLFNILNHRNYI